MPSINYDKHIREGWTVQHFIDDMEMMLRMIMTNQSWKKPLQSKAELKEWCMDNQPYYKKHIPEVVAHFAKQYNLK
jgi:hypothetical protein